MLYQAYLQMKSRYRRDQLNFITPPPNPNMNTLDMDVNQTHMINSFSGELDDDPDISSPKRRKLNMLKESVSKLSTDFMQDRMFLNQIIQSSQSKNFKNNRTIDQNDSTLPMIRPSRISRNGPIKSPVMESIRMSKQNQSRAFASLQKYRLPMSPDKQEKYENESSKSSDKSDIRKSFISARKIKQMNASMNKGTFFVHKRDDKKSKEPNENVVRASTFLANSMIFNKFKKRSSKNKVKASIVIDNDDENIRGSSNVFAMTKRTSKTFVETDMFKNKLSTAYGKRRKDSDSLRDSKMESNIGDIEMIDNNILLSMKSIDYASVTPIKQYEKSDSEIKRCPTKAQTSDRPENKTAQGMVGSDSNVEDDVSDNF